MRHVRAAISATVALFVAPCVASLVMPVAVLLVAAGVGATISAQDTPSSETVRSVTVEGNRRYTADQLISALGIRVGEPLDAEAVDRVGVRVLFERFFTRAEVYRKRVDPSLGDGIDVRVVVTELAVDLEPRFVGNVEIDDEELYEWAELSERSELYLYQAPRIQQRLLRNYHDEGFYFAEVTVVDRPGGVDPETGLEVAPDVVFEIKEGPEVKVSRIVITGNETLPDQRILFFKTGLSTLAEVDLRKPRIFGLFPKDFVEDKINADIIAMREVYRDYGFLNAVVELERLEFSEDREWVTIHVAIDEGGRYTVGSITVEGVELVLPEGARRYEQRPAELLYPEQELLDVLETKVGAIYERRHHSDDERALRKYYGERGHIDHQSLRASERWRLMQPILTFEKDAPVVHLTYPMSQGHEVFVREIVVAGNVHTQDRLIRDEITADPGEVADPVEIERSLARLTATGFFSDPGGLTHLDPTYRYLDTNDSSWKDLEFRVDEGQLLSLNLAGGISSNTGAFGVVGLSMKNFDVGNPPDSWWNVVDEVATRRAFHGAGQDLTIKASPGTEYSTFSVRFTDPDVLRRHRKQISLSLTAQETLRRFRTHDEARSLYGFTIGRQLTIDSGVYAGYMTGDVTVDEIFRNREAEAGNPFTVPRKLKEQEGTLDLAHVVLGYRYSTIDNRLNTRNGIRFNFDNQFYDRAIGSDVNFVKSTMTFDWWDEFDEDPYVVSPYYHLQLAGGVTKAYGDSGPVPFTEQFFLGGLSTLRGYRFRGVGPNERNFAAGGQTMLHGTLEYRYPIVKQIQPGTYREYESLQAGLFLDFGVLDADDFALDTNDIRVTAGFLFGVSVPIPITFSFGWPLRRVEEADGDDRERVFGFNIGF